MSATLADILHALDAAVRAGDAARQTIADAGSGEPFARVLLQETGEGTGKLRHARDLLRAAMIEVGRGKTVSDPQPSAPSPQSFLP